MLIYKYQLVSVKIRVDVIIEDSHKTSVSAAHDLSDQVDTQICLAGTYCIGTLPTSIYVAINWQIKV